MVEFSFYALSGAALLMVTLLFKGFSKKKVLSYLGLGVVGWGSYLLFLTQIGVLRSFDFPPRVPLLIVLPLIGFIIFLLSRRFMQDSLDKTPLHIPVLLQSFRIFVELLIYATYLKGIFPQRATFEGLNFDIVVGISALFVGFAVYKGIIKPKGLLVWNIASLCVLLLTVFSFISAYYFSDFGSKGEAFKFVEFPFLLLAAILLPTAVFLHIYSLKQITRRNLK